MFRCFGLWSEPGRRREEPVATGSAPQPAPAPAARLTATAHLDRVPPDARSLALIGATSLPTVLVQLVRDYEYVEPAPASLAARRFEPSASYFEATRLDIILSLAVRLRPTVAVRGQDGEVQAQVLSRDGPEVMLSIHADSEDQIVAFDLSRASLHMDIDFHRRPGSREAYEAAAAGPRDMVSRLKAIRAEPWAARALNDGKGPPQA